MAGFRRTRTGIEGKLRAGEMAVLRHLVRELVSLLESDAAPAADSADPLAALVGIPEGVPPTPTDPVLARLLPAGYRDDDEAAAEFRRYTEGDLRAAKRASAERVLAGLQAGPRLSLDEEAAQAWLGTLNDLRLSLGTTLSVTEDTYAEMARLRPSDPRARLLAVYGWLGYLQETLVTAVAGE
jgi:hypothetical protein